MPFSAKKRLQRRSVTGMTALTLLLLAACVAPSPQRAALPPSPPSTTLPLPRPQVIAPVSEGIQPLTSLPEAAAATTPPPNAEEQKLIAAAAIEPAAVADAAQPDYYESFASYYAKRFNGRRTFTGERYDPERMTAATRDFPLQCWLKVINPANGREVNVRINDRTGKRKTPLVDLSRAAAKKLGFLGKGKIRVHVIPLLPAP